MKGFTGREAWKAGNFHAVECEVLKESAQRLKNKYTALDSRKE